ncbi:MAG: hypothetical protein KJ984_01635, partial [Nanoarchaeota archaeon]|nr:hypothetical protein [Nanoarchaeota archaeon]
MSKKRGEKQGSSSNYSKDNNIKNNKSKFKRFSNSSTKKVIIVAIAAILIVSAVALISKFSGTLSLTGLTVFAEGTTSNATFYDQNDLGLDVIPGLEVKFFANYSDSSGNSITGAGVFCEISFNTSTTFSTPINMTYNATSLLYEYVRSFTSAGTFYWNGTCDGSSQGYDILSGVDSILVTNNPPSIDTLTLNTTNPATDDTTQNLTANVVTIDLDGHSVKPIYNWLKDGVSTTVLNMPFEQINNTATNNAW